MKKELLSMRNYYEQLIDIGEALEARFVLEDKLILLVLDAARVKHPA